MSVELGFVCLCLCTLQVLFRGGNSFRLHKKGHGMSRLMDIRKIVVYLYESIRSLFVSFKQYFFFLGIPESCGRVAILFTFYFFLTEINAVKRQDGPTLLVKL